LWAWAATLAVIVALAWILGSWSTGSNVVHSLILLGVGGYLAWLIVTGWIEWRQQRRNRNAPD
jgi:threonine/homoserine/homoserine lactone efflux protein